MNAEIAAPLDHVVPVVTSVLTVSLVSSVPREPRARLVLMAKSDLPDPRATAVTSASPVRPALLVSRSLGIKNKDASRPFIRSDFPPKVPLAHVVLLVFPERRVLRDLMVLWDLMARPDLAVPVVVLAPPVLSELQASTVRRVNAAPLVHPARRDPLVLR